jgi:hypothetical protein
VEAELTQSGVIAQAFVHGEAAAQPGLLWPLDPAPATRPSNRPCSSNAHCPITPGCMPGAAFPPPSPNETLTANGRPRREAILQRYHTLLSDISL